MGAGIARELRLGHPDRLRQLSNFALANDAPEVFGDLRPHARVCLPSHSTPIIF